MEDRIALEERLRKENDLQQIPYVYAERRDEDTYWYFIPKNAPKPTALYKRDENYIL